MSSTCPVVPSFSGIRLNPSAPKRTVPNRRQMPKSRQGSASTAAATKISPVSVTPKEQFAKPKLTVTVPTAAESPQRDDGPEEGEVSDEDDHYSPAEATMPVPLPVSNQGVKPNQITKEQQSLDVLRNAQNLKTLSLEELRKKGLSAVMYLACSKKISFEEIVAEGVNDQVLFRFWVQLKLPYPGSGKPKNPNENTTPAIITSTTAVEMPKSNGLPPIPPNGLPPIPLNVLPPIPPSGLPPIPPNGLPPIPPPQISISEVQASNAKKPASVVSRFNKSIPGLNLARTNSGSNSTPPPPTLVDSVPMEITPSPPQTAVLPNNSNVSTSTKTRKRPVAADFDNEIKYAAYTPKQPRFGNRENLETSQLLIDVSDAEDEEGHKKPAVTSIPSRPESTKPEVMNEIREKEKEIELMRQKIVLAQQRKRKLAAVGEMGSRTPSNPPTPLPLLPSADLLGAKDSKIEQVEKLEQVEQFLHETLDQINAQANTISDVSTTPMDIETETELTSSVDNPNLNDSAVERSDNSVQESQNDSEMADSELEDLSSDPEEDITQRDIQIKDDNAISASVNGDEEDAMGDPMDTSYPKPTSNDPETGDVSRTTSDNDGVLSHYTKHSLQNRKSDRQENSESGDNGIYEASDDSDSVMSMDDGSQVESLEDESTSSSSEEESEDDFDPEARETETTEASLIPSTKLSQVPIPGNAEPLKPRLDLTQPEKPDQPRNEFIPYKSPLTCFKSFRYHPNFSSQVSQGFKSLTYSNHIDPELPICDFETRGGSCNDLQCRWQHFRQMALSEDQIILELAEPDANQPDKEEYKTNISTKVSQASQDGTKNFDQIAQEVVGFRQQKLGDPTRVLRSIT